eukprot:2012-Heterococcus_DN1.PRE.2
MFVLLYSLGNFQAICFSNTGSTLAKTALRLLRSVNYNLWQSTKGTSLPHAAVASAPSRRGKDFTFPGA